MTLADPIGDMITRIRNAQLRTLYNVKVPSSKYRAKILEVLKQEGYISNYKLLPDSKNKSSLVVDLKYYNGLPVIKEIKNNYVNHENTKEEIDKLVSILSDIKY